MNTTASKSKSEAPDWDALTAVNAEAQALIDAGKWTRPEFERLLVEARKAVNEHTMFLQGFLMLTEHLP